MNVVTKYHDFKAWKAEVERRGFTTYTYCDPENGPSPDDLWESTFAIKTGADPRNRDDWEEVGIWQCEWPENPTSEADGVWVGYLFDTHSEFVTWQYSDDFADVKPPEPPNGPRPIHDPWGLSKLD